jgi:outer membrane protein OmpA-like peptidoglycan-associated protein
MSELLPLPRLTRGVLLSAVLLCAIMLAGCQTPPPPAPHGLTDAQVAVLKQQGFVDTDDGWTLGLSDKLLFATDEDTLTPESGRVVTRIGQSLLAVGILRLRVLGYTDSAGSDSYNDALSERRAIAVAAVLVSTGMAPGNVRQRGLGKRNPVADNRTEEGRAQNRRVAIVVEAE